MTTRCGLFDWLMKQERLFKIRDARAKDRFQIDDQYLNGWAKQCGWQATLVYMSLCRHADRDGESFPSIELMSKELKVGINTIRRGVKSLLNFNIISIERVKNSKGRWLNNLYVLMDKSVWKETHRPIGAMESTALIEPIHRPNTTIVHRPIGALKELRQEKELHVKDTEQGSEVEKDISDIIHSFREVNPSYENYYKRKPQREATRRLLETHGKEKLLKITAWLIKTNQMPYFPTITTPVQLEENFGRLQASFLKEKNKRPSVAVIR